MSKILLDYDELLGNILVRGLIALVNVDNENETINDDQSNLRHEVAKLEANAFFSTRIAIKKFINKHYFDAYEWTEDLEHFYYERKFSLSKLLIVGLTLEAINLKRIGGVPMWTDIPQAYAALARDLATATAHWAGIKAKFEEKHKKSCEIGAIFTKFYCA